MYYGNNDFRDYLAHANNHKYVKREWVNGKWKYWYPEDMKTAPNAVSRFMAKRVKQAKKFVRTNARDAQRAFVKKYDSDGDGKITKKSTSKYFDITGDGKFDKKDLRKEGERILLDGAERVGTAVYKTKKGLKKVADNTKAKAHALKTEADTNDDGRVSYKEGKKLVKKKVKNYRYDTNKDGRVDLKERVKGTAKDTVNKVRYDSNRDFKVSPGEYVKGKAGDSVKKLKKRVNSDISEMRRDKNFDGKVGPLERIGDTKAVKGVKKAAKNAERTINNYRYDTNRDGKTSVYEKAKGTVQDKYKTAKRKRKIKKTAKKVKKFVYDHTDKAF